MNRTARRVVINVASVEMSSLSFLNLSLHTEPLLQYLTDT